MREAHAPRQGSGNSIIAAARKQAPDAPDPVTDRRGRRACVEHLEQRKFLPPRQPYECRESRNQPAEPRETIAAKNLPQRVSEEVARRLEHVIYLRAHDPDQ